MAVNGRDGVPSSFVLSLFLSDDCCCCYCYRGCRCRCGSRHEFSASRTALSHLNAAQQASASLPNKLRRDRLNGHVFGKQVVRYWPTQLSLLAPVYIQSVPLFHSYGASHNANREPSVQRPTLSTLTALLLLGIQLDDSRQTGRQTSEGRLRGKHHQEQIERLKI